MEITVFYKDNIGTLRATVIDNRPFFFANDVDTIIRPIGKPEVIIKTKVAPEDHKKAQIKGELIDLIAMMGVYEFIRLDLADTYSPFKYWFTDEILPVMVVKAAGMSPENVHVLDAVKCYHHENL